MIEGKTFDLKNHSSMNRDLLLTKGDLEDFKIIVLQEIRNLLKELNSSSSQQWVKSKDVRKMLGISSGTLQNLRTNGMLPYIKLGGTILYKYEDIVTRLDKEVKPMHK
jgi:hypothetical protein